MKLGLVCRPLTFHGGIETATAGLLAELVRRGHAVELLTTAHQGEVPGVSLRRLHTTKHPSALRILSFALAARRAVRTGGYDLVQSHERVLLQDIYRAGEGCHRAYLAAMARHGARVNPYHLVVLGLEKRIFRLTSARHIVAISRKGKAEIERLYATPPDRVTVIYNGVDLQRFHPDHRACHRRTMREALGIPEASWLALFVGSGFERKGLAPLIEALARLGDRESRLVVAGKGDTTPYRTLTARLGLDDRVVWLPPTPRVERLYAAADLVALPARYEPFGNVHLEALASGLPVLTSARAGGAELIRSSENGWVVDELNAAAIAQGLEALRSRPSAELSQAARRSAEPFTHAAQADAFAELYRRLKG